MNHPPPRLSLRAHLFRWAARHLIAPALDTRRPVAVRRAALERAARWSRLPLPPCTRIEPATFRGVPGDWVRNTRQSPRRTLLYLHGGGYQVGSPRIYREFAAQLARRWQAQVALIDYRLAPEHPFPAATDDAFAAYRSLLEQGVDPKTLIIAGDSAGGGLTMACALAARDAGLPLPAALVVFSPWVDLTVSGETAQTRERDDMLVTEFIRAAAADYLAGASPRTPLASPLHADLHGLPPTLIQATDNEILCDDARRLADALRASGVDAQLQLAPRLFHVWQLFCGKLPEADAAIAQAARFIDAHVPA
ncbi:alpha/beta hydrolase [Sinimarinibacterium thermocellulolyticum]|uniref:Alpha/beta hydrolase n=1 Tax=Sinimarinibacterium thermocellulolyticum TaxID=3170016 RepID=A0ABV2AC15_9GAMM